MPKRKPPVDRDARLRVIKYRHRMKLQTSTLSGDDAARIDDLGAALAAVAEAP
jgi:hypothetical protein